MPFGLIATTSSLWMNFPSASVSVLVPVYSVSALSSMALATSGFGQSWFGCMYEAKSPLAETLTILPGTVSGVKPAGGLAISESMLSAAAAEVAWASALAATPAEATVNTSRRDTLGDWVVRWCIVASVENPTQSEYHGPRNAANLRQTGTERSAIATRRASSGQAKHATYS